MQAANVAAAASVLPNPFIAGNPLSGAQRWGQLLFRGRERQIQQVERLLADAHSANSFALPGAAPLRQIHLAEYAAPAIARHPTGVV